MLYLYDNWLWDFWIAQNGPDYHLFYLQAPRSLEDPEKRHWHTSIGHAVSQDLRTWAILPDALHPADDPAWDDYTTWTGSVIFHEGRWWMFYTGTSHAEEGLVQRIGAATSEDLVTWERHSANPLIEADPQWYELLTDDWHDQAWRDPYIIKLGDTFHALITARVSQGPVKERGVIGHATSTDLVTWEVGPPLTEPGSFGQMEVPQWVQVAEDRYLLLFSTTADVTGEGWPGEKQSGTHYLVADEPLGPWRLERHDFLVGDDRYAAKLVPNPDGDWRLLAWRIDRFDLSGDFEPPYPLTTG